MPIKLPVSSHHTRNFLDAIKTHTQPICDIETAVRSDTVCQLALIAAKQSRMLQPHPFRGEWKLPEVG